MVRISDARMTGTAYGIIVLHVAPDAASGGPLGLVRNSGVIRLNVERRTIEVLPSDEKLERRAKLGHRTGMDESRRDYAKLYQEQSCRPAKAANFGFLKPG
jgi:dihydroxy-acid dehydratase